MRAYILADLGATAAEDAIPCLAYRQLFNGAIAAAQEPCSFPDLGEAKARVQASHLTPAP